MTSEAEYREWMDKDIRELPEIGEILEYTKRMNFRKKLFFGYDKEDALEHITLISRMYETAMRKLQKKNEKYMESLQAELDRQRKQMETLSAQHQADSVKICQLENEREAERTEYLQMAQMMEQITRAQQGILSEAREEAEQILRDSYDKAVSERQRASEEAQGMLETANRQVYEKQRQADELSRQCELLQKEYRMRMAKAQEEIRKLKESMDGMIVQLAESGKRIENDPGLAQLPGEMPAQQGVLCFDPARAEENTVPKLVTFGNLAE